MAEEGTPVDLYVYDLTLGFASLLAPAIIGREVEGVWHTAVVAYGREYFYGGGGITSCEPGSTQLGAPHRVERLGATFVPAQVFHDYIHGLATTTYTGGAYQLLSHNCNHFSDEVAQFLCGARVPKHILQQPEQLLAAPQRAALQALLDAAPPAHRQTQHAGERRPRGDSPDYDALNHQIEEARVVSRSLEAQRSSLADKLKRKERRKEKKCKKLQRDHAANGDDTDLQSDHDHDADMAEAVATSAEARPAGPSALEGLDLRREEEMRRRADDPPILYKDIDGLAEFEELSKELAGVELTAEERQSVEELQQYLQGEGSWVLGDDFLGFVGRVLSDAALKGGARVQLLRCLAAAALREDVSLLLHQDRRHHSLLNYAHSIDRRPHPEQEALALFMCNLFENLSSSEWLLYISEWEHNGQPLSNIRATTKVCVHALLSPEAALREAGTALLYNLATKEVKTVVFDEVCVELAMAVLQLLQQAPSEEHLYRALRALGRLATHSSDVPQLVAMVGPDPALYRGTSARVDAQIDALMQRVK